MRKLIKIMMCACICICALAIFKVDAYADDFDSDFGKLVEGNKYSLTVSIKQTDGTPLPEGAPYHDYYRFPGDLIKSIDCDGDVYVAYYRFKHAFTVPNQNDSEYSFAGGFVYFSKDSFSLNLKSTSTDGSSSDLSLRSSNYNGVNLIIRPWMTICGYYNGYSYCCTGLAKEFPNQTYNFVYDSYIPDVDDVSRYTHVKDEIRKLLYDGSSDEASCDDTSGGFSDERDESEADASIGALKIADRFPKMVYLHGQNNSTDVTSAIWKFKFKNKTTTNYSVKGDGHYIQYGFRMSGYQSLYRGGAKEDLSNYVSGYYYLSDLDSLVLDIPYSVLSSELQNYFNNSSNYKSYFGQYYNTQIYFRLCYKDSDGTYKHGTWIRYNTGDASEERTDDDTVDEGETDDGGIPEDGEYDDDHGSDPANTDAGVGDDYDEAEDNADDNAQSREDSESGNISFDSIKELVNQIGNVPLLIKKVFSFLPSWCLTLIATAFVMFVILMLVKVIRG